MEVKGQLHVSASCNSSVGVYCTHHVGGRVGPKVGLDAVANRRNPITSPCRELNPGRLAQWYYTVDACALTSILPSLFFIHMIYFTADTKATPASVQGVGVDF
jgi:hypothetical protein